jgi:hypothetical protein
MQRPSDASDDPLGHLLRQGARSADDLIRRWARSLLTGDGRAKAKKGPRQEKAKPAAR